MVTARESGTWFTGIPAWIGQKHTFFSLYRETFRMRIACLQFAPQVGDLDNNLNRADSVLSRANPEDLDLLVLPELAFTGMCCSRLAPLFQCCARTRALVSWRDTAHAQQG